jgi:hypothetical protein
MATAVLRERSEEPLVLGLAAISVEDVRFDFRESLTGLVLLYHGGCAIGLDPAPLFEEMAVMSGDGTAVLVKGFLKRSPEIRSLEAFFFRIDESKNGPQFSWAPPGLHLS